MRRSWSAVIMTHTTPSELATNSRERIFLKILSSSHRHLD
jgi:hypothetical protein